MSDKLCDFFKSALLEAERGLAVAQHAVGAMYDSGRGVAQDKAAAICWYQKAAGQGHPDSLFLLGVKYRMGDGVERDDDLALHYFRLAAKRGRVEGVLGLGRPDVDATEVTLATAQNLAAAQYDLGRMYLEESCWLHDPARAARWLLLAAEGGVSDAQYLVGMMFEAGFGVEENSTLAVKWLRQAAEGGHEEAQSSLRSYLAII